MSRFTETMASVDATPHHEERRLEATTSRLDAFESLIGDRLPADYRDFLLEFAGYTFVDSVVGTLADERIEDDFVAVETFYGFYLPDLEQTDPADLIANFQEAQVVPPHRLLPIASCCYGNQLCLAISGPMRGAVYFLDHEEFPPDEFEPEVHDELLADGVYLVQRSFSDFIDSLRLFDSDN